MKKIIRFIIAATLVFQTVMHTSMVMAAGGWKVSYSGSINTNRETHFASITEDYTFSGESAMMIKYPGTKTEGNYVEIKYEIPEKIESGEYILTFYNKGAKSALTEICVGDSITLAYGDTTPVKILPQDAPSGETNWYRYEYTISYTEQSKDYVLFRYYGGTQQTVIDDVSLVPAAGGDNLIVDSSFDSIAEAAPSDEPFDTTDYQLKNLMTSGGNGKVCVSWVNPETEELKKVRIYDATNDQWELLSDSLSVVPGQTNYYTLEGLGSGEKRRFAVTLDFATKPSFTYYITGGADASDAKSFGGWSVQEMKNGKAGYCPGKVTLERDEDGNCYAKITSNIDGDVDENLSGNIYIRLWQALELEAGAVYKLNMRAKFDGVESVTMLMGWDWSGFVENGPDFSGTDEWQDYSFTYITENDLPEYFHIIVETPGVMMLDDVELYKTENGEIVGENLLSDGGFDEMFSDSVGMLTSAEIYDEDMDSMTMSWSGSSSKIAAVNLYQKLFDKYEYRGTLDLDNASLRIGQLSVGTEYSFMLKPVNSLGYEGEGIEVSGKTLMPEYEITEPVLYKTNLQMNSISGSGTYTVQSTLKNYSVEDMSYTQAVVLYKNGIIEKIYATQVNSTPQEKNKPAVKVNTSFTITEGTGYTLEVFCLDSLDTLNILQKSKKF